MSDIENLTKRVLAFRDARDWKQFHTPKDMVLSLLMEAAELAEHVQWKDAAQFKEHLVKNRGDVAAELSDCLYWILLMAHESGIDLVSAFETKMQQNELKYPVESSKGSAAKYSELK